LLIKVVWKRATLRWLTKNIRETKTSISKLISTPNPPFLSKLVQRLSSAIFFFLNNHKYTQYMLDICTPEKYYFVLIMNIINMSGVNVLAVDPNMSATADSNKRCNG